MPARVYVSHLKGFLPEIQVDDDSMELSLLSDGSLTVRLMKIPTDLDHMSWEDTVHLTGADLEKIRNFINSAIEIQDNS